MQSQTVSFKAGEGVPFVYIQSENEGRNYLVINIDDVPAKKGKGGYPAHKVFTYAPFITGFTVENDSTSVQILGDPRKIRSIDTAPECKPYQFVSAHETKSASSLSVVMLEAIQKIDEAEIEKEKAVIKQLVIRTAESELGFARGELLRDLKGLLASTQQAIHRLENQKWCEGVNPLQVSAINNRVQEIATLEKALDWLKL